MTYWASSLFEGEICYWWISFVFLQEVKEKIMVGYIENVTDAERKMAQSSIESLTKHAGKLSGNNDESIEIPTLHIPVKAFDLLKSILGDMAAGKRPKFVTGDIEMNVLQVSQVLRLPVAHINRLLDGGKIPYHTSGEEKRIFLGDALVYVEERKKRQAEGVKLLIEEAQELKLGY